MWQEVWFYLHVFKRQYRYSKNCMFFQYQLAALKPIFATRQKKTFSKSLYLPFYFICNKAISVTNHVVN